MKFFVSPDFETAINLETQERGTRYRTSSRYVYIFSDVVLKLDGNDDHTFRQQCEAEARYYQTISPENRSYFAEILEAGYYWDIPYVIHKRVFGTYCYDEDLQESLKEKFNLEDLHERNVFLDEKTGQPVIVDYGINYV